MSKDIQPKLMLKMLYRLSLMKGERFLFFNKFSGTKKRLLQLKWVSSSLPIVFDKGSLSSASSPLFKKKKKLCLFHLLGK